MIVTLDAAPAAVGVDAPAPTTVTALADPVAPIGVAVPAAQPAFTVAVTADTDGLQVQVQYDTDPGFGAPGTAVADAPAGLLDAQVSVGAAVTLTDGAWYWRARVTGAYGAGPWSDTAGFAVNSLEGQAVASGSRTVAAGTPTAPHLWFVEPDDDGTDTGGTAHLIGTGFGPGTQVQLGDVACPVTAVTAVAATGATDPVIVPGATVDPWHQRVTFTIGALDTDTTGEQVTVAGGNGVFLPLLPAVPLPGAGWTVKVYAHTDLYAYARGKNPKPIALVSRFVKLWWSPEISAVGAGGITLRTDDPLFSYALADGRTPDSLYRYDNLWVLYQDGQWRGEFFGEKVDIARVPADEAAGRLVTISGPGSAQALAWARVMSPYYPKTTPKGKIGVYQYKNLPVMASWLQLLGAAQARGTIPFVHVKFSAAKDTGGAKWEDTPAAKPPTSTATTTLGDVAFDHGSWTLNTAGQAAVKALAAKLAPVTAPKITVTGHTDSVGSTAANYQQGLDRASTVANAILAIRTHANVSTASKGETQPVASNRTAAGRAKNRRVVVTYQAGTAYTDTIYTPERGTTLLELLQQLTSGQTTAENRGPIHCEWVMGKGFQLQVRSQIGANRSTKVIFHEGSTYMQSDAMSFDRTDVANLIAVQDDLTVYKTAYAQASADMWGQRELYTRIEGSYAAAVHAQIAQSQRAAYQNQTVSTTVVINPGAGRTPFVDFNLGDEIGLSKSRGKLPSTIDAQRVIAITVTVDADGNAAYELTLQSTFARRVAWLQTQIDALTNRKRGVRAFIQDDEPTGGLPGDLWTPETVVHAS